MVKRASSATEGGKEPRDRLWDPLGGDAGSEKKWEKASDLPQKKEPGLRSVSVGCQRDKVELAGIRSH